VVSRTASEVHEDYEGCLEEEKGATRSMIYEFPDVDLQSMSLDELKAYARVCAGLENQIRAYVISVHAEIVKRVNQSFPVQASLVRVSKGKKQMTHKNLKEMLEEDEDDFATMDSFR
jgi:hypothetical protein